MFFSIWGPDLYTHDIEDFEGGKGGDILNPLNVTIFGGVMSAKYKQSVHTTLDFNFLLQ